VAYKQRCSEKSFRLSAGLLAFAIAGFNLACVGYLVLIQPNHADLMDYVHIVASTVLLVIVMRFKGNTSRMIDWVLNKPAG
ncbi:MAG TPA: hypothetical protein VFC74_05800, partial [Oscillospiraceae bacterium]|nr:hypothetical protein [Oscillospiraceae bacterium]